MDASGCIGGPHRVAQKGGFLGAAFDQVHLRANRAGKSTRDHKTGETRP
jgi:hypothetical protein